MIIIEITKLILLTITQGQFNFCLKTLFNVANHSKFNKTFGQKAASFSSLFFFQHRKSNSHIEIKYMFFQLSFHLTL